MKSETSGEASPTMAIPSPEGMTADEFKWALLSSLENEYIGTLREIDRRLRERKILITGYNIDPIVGYVAVKIDVMREIRPPDETKVIAEKGTRPLLEDVFGGLPGYVVVTDAQLKIDNFDATPFDIQSGQDEGPGISMQITMNIEHTYVMKDGKYLCEWGDPANPLHKPKDLFEKRKPTKEVTEEGGIHVIRYNL